jgi:hypothetical protein
MDGHQLRGARIHRDMMLVSSVCRRALGCEWGGNARTDAARAARRARSAGPAETELHGLLSHSVTDRVRTAVCTRHPFRIYGSIGT